MNNEYRCLLLNLTSPNWFVVSNIIKATKVKILSRSGEVPVLT